MNSELWGGREHRITIRDYRWTPEQTPPRKVIAQATFTIGAPLTAGQLAIEVRTPQVVETQAQKGGSCSTTFPAVSIAVVPKLSPEL